MKAHSIIIHERGPQVDPIIAGFFKGTTVCPIWKSLTLFYNYGEANYILALSKAVFSMILAYILIFENFFGFRDR